MTEIIFGIIIAVFCLLGVSELIHIVKQSILSPKKRPEARLVIFLDGGTPDLQLISTINECSWSRALRNVKLIGVYSDMPKAVLESCEAIAMRHNIELYSINKAEDTNILNLI